jgi:hypothetical protein
VPTDSARPPIPPADPRDVLRVERTGAGYKITGTYGAARIVAGRDPLTAEHAARYLRAFPRAVVEVAALRADDPLFGVLVTDQAGQWRPYSVLLLVDPDADLHGVARAVGVTQ